MMGRSPALLPFAALLVGALAVSGPAAAQCRLCATPTTEVSDAASAQPVRIDVQARLDFDQVVVLDNSGSGTARILPDGSSSTSGPVGVLSGRAMVGSVILRGEPGRHVRVDMPGVVDLYGLRGGRLRLDSLVTDLPANPRLDSQGSLQFRFGGVLHIEGDADGDFRGDVPITVDYL